MSRSRRNAAIAGIAVARSDKPAKVAADRRERVAARSALAREAEPPHRLAYGDPWDAPKDGKRWWGYGRVEMMRK